MATWYVRPDTSHSATRDGTTYEKAWGGWSEIVWGTASGVRGSTQDTLYICGNLVTSSITVGAHGGASTSQIATIRGDYPGDPGAITLSGSAFLTATRSFTAYRNLRIVGGTASSVVYQSGAALQQVTWAGVRMSRPTASGNGFVFDGANGNNYSDILIDDCDFDGDYRNGSNATGCVHWLVSAASAVSTMTRMSVMRSRFNGAQLGRSAVHLRIQSGASLSSRMEDIRVEENDLTGVGGCGIEVNDNHSTYGNSAGLRIVKNRFSDIEPSSVDQAMGGCILAWGFRESAALGIPLIELNRGARINGAIGGVDAFWGRYIIRRNFGEDFSTPTIDGNGVLLDLGCRDSEVYRNRYRRLRGKTGVDNSGVGVMILEATGAKVHHNMFDGCQSALFLGAAGAGQSADFSNNTALGVTLYGFNIRPTATPANLTGKNNVLVAAGPAVPSVRNQAGAWTGEDFNFFSGFAPAIGHTLGANSRTGDPRLTTEGVPLYDSPLLTSGADLGYLRDIRGIQSRRHIGAFGRARMLTA